MRRSPYRCGLLPAYYLELTSGLRRGELLALLWTDLDVENMTISVTKQMNRVNGQLKVSQPKTSNPIRTIPIPKQAVDLLILEHEKHPDNPYMFPSPTPWATTARASPWTPAPMQPSG